MLVYIEWNHIRMPPTLHTRQRPKRCLFFLQIMQLLRADLKQPSLLGLSLVVFPTWVNISLNALW